MARTCRRYKDHGVISVLKGHRLRCLHQYCDCHLCSVVERQNLLQQRTYNKKERPNETDVANETLGTSTSISLPEAANGLHQKDKETKNKTVAERRQGELL